MAALTKSGFFGFGRAAHADRHESKKARAFANKAYKEMGNKPTEKMKKSFAALLENERRSDAG
jgi:hypothetical protein